MDRDKLIVSKKVIANTAAKQYIQKYPSLSHLRDDLRSAALVGVIKAIDHLRENGEQITNAYLMKAAQREMFDTVDDLGDSLPIPRSTKSLAKKNGVKIEPTFVDRLPDDYDCVDDRGPSLLCQVSDACRTETERTIIELLSAGFNQRQIGTKLQTDPRRISEMLQTIKQRVRNGEDGIDTPYIPVPKGRDGKCRCGQPVARWSNAETCEDCFGADSQRFHGNSQRVRVSA